MALRARESKVVQEFKVASNHSFIQAIDKTRLTDLTLEELANRYVQIDTQSHLMKGLILLEARSRFPSNQDFGNWVKTVFTLCEDAAPVRNRLMRYAAFFKDRDATGISLTACYEIALQSKEIAEEIYTEVKGKNYSVAEVKDLISERIGIKDGCSKKEFGVIQAKNKIINIVHQFEEAEAIDILESCLRMVKHESVEVHAKTDTGRKRF